MQAKAVKYQKMFEWSWATKEEYYISVSKKFKVICSKEKKWEEMGFSEECSPKTVHYPAYYLGID